MICQFKILYINRTHKKANRIKQEGDDRERDGGLLNSFRDWEANEVAIACLKSLLNTASCQLESASLRGARQRAALRLGTPCDLGCL